MKDYLYQLIQNKKLLILGFGREGESSYKTIRKYFPEFRLSIADQDENSLKTSTELKNDKFVQVISGKDYLKSLDDFDLIIKTPGISLKQINFRKELITSQTNIFLEVYSRQVIGITGTKGKSTTSSLIYSIVHAYNKNSILVGNIGIPPFDMIDNIDGKTIIVCELSSHQLEFISTSPHISIILNLYQEHLDHYKDYKEYQLSKFNIAKYQEKGDCFVFHQEDELIRTLIKENKLAGQLFPYSKSSVIENGMFAQDQQLIFNQAGRCSAKYEISKDITLKGEHSLLNIMAAITACKMIGIPDDAIIKGVETFKGLEHRIEFVGKYNDILYYNDSIATIPEATMEAVKTLKMVNTIILGGFDRGIDYSDFARFLNKTSIEHLIFIEEAGLRILSELKKIPKLHAQEYFVVSTFKEATEIARNKTRKNTICLLSPAAASYGMFKNFEERGKVYKKLVKYPDESQDN